MNILRDSVGLLSHIEGQFVYLSICNLVVWKVCAMIYKPVGKAIGP